MAKLNPNKLTLDALRIAGWVAAPVEQWVPHTAIRRDLFGFLDILAVKGVVTLGIQATSRGNVADRMKKVMTHENFPAVAIAGWKVEVWGWDKQKMGRRVHFRLRREKCDLDHTLLIQVLKDIDLAQQWDYGLPLRDTP